MNLMFRKNITLKSLIRNKASGSLLEYYKGMRWTKVHVRDLLTELLRPPGSWYWEALWIFETYKLSGQLECINNGKLLRIIPYKRGKLHGDEFSFYENGNVHKVISYKNGKCHGLCITNYEDGTLCEIASFKNNKRQGIQIKNNSRGKVIFYHRYDNGRILF